MIQVGAHIPVTWRTLMNSVQGTSARPCKPGISFVTIFCYFVNFLEKYDSSVLNVIFQQKFLFFCKRKKFDIKELLQQSTIWVTQQFVWVNFLHLITKESSIATHPKDFCEKNLSKLPNLEIISWVHHKIEEKQHWMGGQNS